MAAKRVEYAGRKPCKPGCPVCILPGCLLPAGRKLALAVLMSLMCALARALQPAFLDFPGIILRKRHYSAKAKSMCFGGKWT